MDDETIEEKIRRIEQEQYEQRDMLTEIKKDMAVIASKNETMNTEYLKMESILRNLTKSVSALITTVKVLPVKMKDEQIKIVQPVWKHIHKNASDVKEVKNWGINEHNKLIKEIEVNVEKKAKTHLSAAWTIFTFMSVLIFGGFFIYMDNITKSIDRIAHDVRLHSKFTIKNETKLDDHLKRHGEGIYLKNDTYKDHY